MHEFLLWIETSAFSVWVRESLSIFAFPSILTAHTIGMGLVAGMNALVDLRILGIAPKVPLLEMRRFFLVMWFGFWLNAVSGVALLIGYPTKALTNPLFYVKLAFIAIAVVLLRSIQRGVFAETTAHPGFATLGERRLAAGSIFCWAVAIGSGRFLAYTYSKLTSLDHG
jgi:hypothetical protein